MGLQHEWFLDQDKSAKLRFIILSYEFTRLWIFLNIGMQARDRYICDSDLTVMATTDLDLVLGREVDNMHDLDVLLCDTFEDKILLSMLWYWIVDQANLLFLFGSDHFRSVYLVRKSFLA